MPSLLPGPNDIVATIKIDYAANGCLFIEGNVGDKKLALGMLDAARERIAEKLTREEGQIIVPNRDVRITQDPRFPTVPVGDMPP